MRYSTQFKIGDQFRENADSILPFEKKKSSAELGVLIGENIGFRFDEDRWRLDVEVFSELEWRMFKRQLKSAIEALNTLGRTPLDLILIGKLIKELEAGEILNGANFDTPADQP